MVIRCFARVFMRMERYSKRSRAEVRTPESFLNGFGHHGAPPRDATREPSRATRDQDADRIRGGEERSAHFHTHTPDQTRDCRRLQIVIHTHHTHDMNMNMTTHSRAHKHSHTHLTVLTEGQSSPLMRARAPQPARGCVVPRPHARNGICPPPQPHGPGPTAWYARTPRAHRPQCATVRSLVVAGGGANPTPVSICTMTQQQLAATRVPHAICKKEKRSRREERREKREREREFRSLWHEKD